jgi:hypothetical protein
MTPLLSFAISGIWPFPITKSGFAFACCSLQPAATQKTTNKRKILKSFNVF